MSDLSTSSVVRSARPLVVTGDPGMLDDLLRLCAAAGVEPQVAHDAVAGRRSWLSAPLVVVGDDVSEALVRASPVRRPDVLLVTRDCADVGVWPRGLALGASQVVVLPDGERWLVERLAEAEDSGGKQALTVSIIGGRGGAGTSSLAAAMALTGMRQDLRTFLVDADPLGGGIDMLLGLEDSEGLRWPELTEVSGTVSGRALREALPQRDSLTVLTWDRGGPLGVPAEAMRTVLTAGQRSNDLVVIDLPRRLDEPVVEALTCSTLALLLVPAEVRATASATRVAHALEPVAADVRLVVRGPAPSNLTGEMVATSLGLPLLAELRPEPGIEAAQDLGDPPARRGKGPLSGFCAKFLESFGPCGGSAAA